MAVNFESRTLVENHEASVATLRNFFSAIVIGSTATDQAYTMTIKETEWQTNIKQMHSLPVLNSEY